MTIEEAKTKGCACIYKLNFPNGKSYVGKTKDLKGRIGIYERFYDANKGGEVSKAIAEYGLDKVDFEILSEVTAKSSDLDVVLSILEIKYIREENTLVPNGYNVSAGGEILNIPYEYIQTYDLGNKNILVYDIEGKFIGEFPSIAKCAYEYNVRAEEISGVIDKRKCLLGKYIFKSKKYNYIPKMIDVTGIKVIEKRRIKTVVVPKYVEKVINIGKPLKTLLYDENGDFVDEFDSKTQACRYFSKSISIPYGAYREGYIMYKKTSDDFPKKIEPYVETIDYILEDEYKPLSQCRKVERVKKGFHKSQMRPHKTLINDFKVRQYDGYGFEKVYANLRDASSQTGIPYSSIWACVNGVTKTARKFMWERLDNED